MNFNTQLLSFLFVIYSMISFGQDGEYITTGTGIYAVQGKKEDGLSIAFTVGYQWSMNSRESIRLNTSLTIGSYLPIFLQGARKQYFRLNTFEGIVHFDLLRIGAVSVVVSPGVFAGYSIGLLGTGDGITRSEEFLHFYAGGRLSGGIRIAPIEKKVAYELRLFNVYLGNDAFSSGGILFTLDIRID